MYTTCLFCHGALGANEVIEHFPVGRRLAFDAGKGRLWVVCHRCERWNLTPVEERWEAIEEAERLFTGTRTRVSTDNIGLARLRDGTSLIRIGGALRPEMAAWRYGDQFGRRRRKHIALSAAGALAIGGLITVGPVMGWVAGGGWGMWHAGSQAYQWYQNRRVRARIRMPDSDVIVPIRRKQLEHVSVRHAGDDWALHVSLRKPKRTADNEGRAEPRVLTYTGIAALRTASRLLPAINASGARSREVSDAVGLISEAGDPMQLFRRYATPDTTTSVTHRRRVGRDSAYEPDGGRRLVKLPTEVRLALEMASHEEQERRALEGELAILEAAWREAEEIAKIADDMFLPESARDLDALRTKD